MSLSELESARRLFDESRGFLTQNVTDAIKAECIGLFSANPGLTNIQWAQKASEYNDEGMYPGVFGPVANRPVSRDDGDGWDYMPAWLDDYGDPDTPSPYDRYLGELRRILAAAGDEVLSEVFGDSAKVAAIRDEDRDHGVKFIVEYVGY
ncbi:MAG: hypothetical protein ACHQ1D_01330 [Nitrososphaerales archaeon]